MVSRIDGIASQESTGQELSAGPSACPLCGSREVADFLRAPDRFHLRKDLYRLMRCSGCFCVWLADPPPPHEMSRHYDEDYHRAITAAGEGSAAIRWKVQRETIAKYKSGGAVLDIGCSSGGFLSTMKGPSWKLYGVEMESSTAERARKTTGGEIFHGDVLDAPFPPESFDLVTTFDVLEHVYQPRKFLRKINELLKPGGIYYTMLPNIDSWEARMLGSYWYGLELPRHLFHFSPQSLSTLMKLSNFEDVGIFTTRTTYLEHSATYIGGAILQKLGGTPCPLAKVQRRSFTFKAIRKALRLAVVIPFAKASSAADKGASIEAIFAKPGR